MAHVHLQQAFRGLAAATKPVNLQRKASIAPFSSGSLIPLLLPRRGTKPLPPASSSTRSTSTSADPLRTAAARCKLHRLATPKPKPDTTCLQRQHHATAAANNTMTDRREEVEEAEAAPAPAPTTAQGSLAQRIPGGAWDSHMHIVDPSAYPLSADAAYRPSAFSLEQALAFEASVGVSNLVIVQPSIYGFDNACLLDALRRLGRGRGRGVVQFDPARTTAEQLRDWHRLGVRGARLNIQSTGREADAAELHRRLRRYADAVRPLGWVVQVYVPMPLVALLEPIVPDLGVRFCIDHIGHPLLDSSSSSSSQGADPYQLAGFSSLVRLLQTTDTYVKLSAPYRITKDPSYAPLEPVARELVRLFGTSRVVFATDWPHTRFEGLDIKPWMEMVLGWCGDDDFLRERLFKGNAEDLWDVSKH